MSPKLVFPYEFRDLQPNQTQAVKDGLYAKMKGLVRVGPENLLLSTPFQEMAKDVYNFEPRKNDVWVASYPRTGTTVSQELVWMVANDMDYEGANEHLTLRFPYLESDMFGFENPDVPSFKIIPNLENLKTRRFIKTHLTYSLLHPNLLTDKGSKVVYVARNPKDVMVSYYHFHNYIKDMNFSGDFQTFSEYFLNDCVLYSPYWDHILQAWENRHRSNQLFIFYEDIKKHPEETIRKVADFLDKKPTETQIRKLKEHLDVNTFKKNPAVNSPMPVKVEGFSNEKESFVRKGEVKNWEKYFTPEMNERVDRLIKEKFHPVGLFFDDC